jgi:hypothetical protein
MLATQPKSSIPSDAAHHNNLLQPFRVTVLDELARSRRTVHHHHKIILLRYDQKGT